MGSAEFDVGVMLAHMLLSSQDHAVLDQIHKSYQPNFNFQWKKAMQFAGVEVMRRMIGVAQLPLQSDEDTKVQILKKSVSWVLDPERDIL